MKFKIFLKCRYKCSYTCRRSHVIYVFEHCQFLYALVPSKGKATIRVLRGQRWLAKDATIFEPTQTLIACRKCGFLSNNEKWHFDTTHIEATNNFKSSVVTFSAKHSLTAGWNECVKPHWRSYRLRKHFGVFKLFNLLNVLEISEAYTYLQTESWEMTYRTKYQQLLTLIKPFSHWHLDRSSAIVCCTISNYESPLKTLSHFSIYNQFTNIKKLNFIVCPK